MLDGIFIGAVATAEMRNAMILMLVTTVAVGELLIPAFGNTGAPQFCGRFWLQCVWLN